MPLTHKDVADIIKLLDTSSLDEFVIDLPDIKLVIRRRGAGGASSDTSAMPALESPRGGAARSSVPALSRTDGAVEVRAPMVGTFYRSPSPKDPPFVEVGKFVKPGQPLCLIEVMKLYTTIEAKHAGKIVEIPAVNGALVEYDQVLFVIQPS